MRSEKVLMNMYILLFKIINKDPYSILHNKLYGKRTQERTCTHLCISESCCSPKTKNIQTHSTTLQVTTTNTKDKIQKENVGSIPLRPWWPGLMSHPWSLGSLGSQGWTVMGLTELGRVCQPMSPAPWIWWACSPLHGPTTSRCSETGREELWKALWASFLLVVGFPPP